MRKMLLALVLAALLALSGATAALAAPGKGNSCGSQAPGHSSVIATACFLGV